MSLCSPLPISARPMRIVAALGLSVLLGAPAGAQEPDSLFIDRIDVNVINVEVFVTDRDGNRVTDLTQDDFEILEDGQPVEITNFYTTQVPDQAVAGFDRDRAEIQDGQPPAPREVAADQQLHLVVFVDNFNIRTTNRNRVLKELGGFLEDRIRQGDRVMLMSYDRQVEVLEPFTQDPYALVQGIERLSKASTFLQQDEARRRRVIREMEIASQSGGGDPLGAIWGYIEERTQELERTARALDAVVRSLGGLPGRKAVLYVSDGLPKRPGQELYQYYIDLFGSAAVDRDSAGLTDPKAEFLSEDRSDLLEDVAREANAHQVTLYTLQAGGPTGTMSSLSAERTPASFNNQGETLAEGTRLFNQLETLVDLAAETGGSAILNTLNFDDAFASLSQDFDSLYSLGYRSRHGGDGRYHKIEVRVKRPGLKARHRTGYVDKSEQERVADRTYSSLILDLEANPLGISLDFGEPEKAGRGKYHLPILVRIPFRDIALLPSGDVQEGRLRLFIAVQDPEGGLSPLQEIPYPLSLPASEVAVARDKEFGYAGKLLLRRGTPKIAVAVWDEISGTESFVHKSAQLGKSKKKDRKRRGG